jgi:hypothetical protein
MPSVNFERARDPINAFTRETMQLGGRILATWTEGGAFASAESRRVRHVFAWSTELGAEHHALVPYALHASAILVRRRERSEWCATDPDVEEWLRAHPALCAVGPRLSFAHVEDTPTNAWMLQLRPLGDGRGHLVLRPGDGGLAELLGLIEHLRMHVPQIPTPEQPFVIEPAFGAIAARSLGATTTPPPPPVSTASGVHPVSDGDYPQRVSVALHFFAAGRYRESVAMWRAIARDTQDRERRWRALQQVGIGYDALEDYERAVHFYELALAEGAPFAEIGEELGRARRRLGETDLVDV